MPRLRLESDTDSFDLDDVFKKGRGVQALSGATGLGLPPVAVQWSQGAGDGARYRGRRVLPRDIDLPILVQDHGREPLKALVSRLALMFADPCTLRFIEDDGSSWTTTVVRVGGGDYVYGQDTTGNKDLMLVVTVRAGDPFFTSSVISSKLVGGTTGKGLLPKLGNLQLSSSTALGNITLNNVGDANAYPFWHITGPTTGFAATSPSGEVLEWNGTLLAGETLLVDTMNGRVTDGTGANRYADIASAPRFWSIPPGLHTAGVSLDGSTAESKVEAQWRARKWLVI